MIFDIFFHHRFNILIHNFETINKKIREQEDAGKHGDIEISLVIYGTLPCFLSLSSKDELGRKMMC